MTTTPTRLGDGPTAPGAPRHPEEHHATSRRLARLGRLAGPLCGRRGKYATVAFWLVLVALLGPLALKLTDARDDSTLESLPAGAEAARAAQRVKAAFPDSEAPVAVAVYARESGLTDADRAKVDSDRAAFARYAKDDPLAPPLASDDGKALLLSFRLAGDGDAQSSAVAEIKSRLRSGSDAGLRRALTGTAAINSDLAEAFSGLDGKLLLATALAVTLLLLITYRSPVLWLIPLIGVGLASQVAGAVVYLLVKRGGLTVDIQSQNIMTVLVFGVGVDYALLLIARYREELRRHRDRHAAMAVALRCSLPAICASAATVTLGLLCLLAARLPATHGLGPVGAVGVVAALLAMSTFLPATLVLFGRWVFWPFVPRYRPEAVGHDIAEDHGAWNAVARRVGRRPRVVWIGTALGLAALALGIGKLSVGLPGDEAFTRQVSFAVGQHLIERHYPGGMTGPADILATAEVAGQVGDAARRVPGVVQVTPPERSADGRWVRIQAILADDPDSAEAQATITRLRSAVHRVPGSQALVGGDSAFELDTRQATNRDNLVVVPLVLGVVLVVLVLLLRALVAPVLLVASVVLSYAAAMGAGGLILSAIGHPRLWFALQLQTFLFLVALGVDYTIFLMTRAREEAGTLGHRQGVLHALTVTGGVITSAGVVLAATFSALGVMPLVPSLQIGIIVAVGVLLDTFVVRSLLIPALVLDVGRRTWWPSRLSQPAGYRAAVTGP